MPKINVTKPQHIGIRGRSFLAFAVLTVFTLLASIVGWVSYNHIEEQLEKVFQVNIHSLKLMEELKDYGNSISIKAPALYVVKDEASQKEIWKELNQSMNEMLRLLPQSPELNLDEKSRSSMVSQIETLGKPLGSLNQNISDQLSVDTEKAAFGQKLRWSTSSFLDDVDSLILIAQKDWYSVINSAVSVPSVGQNLEVLYRIKADFSVLANLIDRVQHLPDLSSLIAVQLHSRELVKSLNKDLKLLKPSEDYNALGASVAELMLLAQGKNNIFSIRRKERNIDEEGQLQLAQIRKDFEKLNVLISKQSAQAEEDALDATDNVRETIKQGRIWTIFLVGGSLLFSILIVWLYVGANIVARISNLNDSMRSIAKGNLDQDVPIKGNDEIGAMAHSLLSFRDQLSTLQEELVQSGKLAALGQLSAGIAHEINQPLTAIRQYTHNSSRLIEMGKLKEAEENLAHITLLTKRIVSTITQLKSLAKGEPTKVVVVDVEQAVNNSIIMLTGHKTLSETILELDLDTDNNHAYADPVQLEQVIVNLLTNALDALVDTEDKHIQISSQRHEDTIDIVVSDNGKGIAKDLRKQIFDTFFTTKRRGQNLGLGLSISYNMVKTFGGNLSIDTEQDIGASFCIQLPRHKKTRK